MGKRSDFKRNPRDYYSTPYKAALPLKTHLPNTFCFVEPCAGGSRLTKHLKSFGGDCLVEYDIEPQDKNILTLDALTLERRHIPNDTDFIITNPPWDRSKKSGYLLHSLIEVFANLRPTWLLIDSDWSNNISAAPYIENYCEKIVPIGRVSFFGGGVAGKDNISWYLFDINKSEPTIFIPRGM